MAKPIASSPRAPRARRTMINVTFLGCLILGSGSIWNFQRVRKSGVGLRETSGAPPTVEQVVAMTEANPPISAAKQGTPARISPLSSQISLDATCPNNGSMKPSSDAIHLSPSEIASFAATTTRLQQVKSFTAQKYERFVTARAGREHYMLLHYLTTKYGDCRHVVDIGTRFVASSVAFAASGSPVVTIDIPTSRERNKAFRGGTEDEWFARYKQDNPAGGDIEFKNIALLDIPLDDFKTIMSTWLVMLDTLHLPKTKPFERAFFDRLKSIGYKGILLLDDIHLNKQMKAWWAEVQAGASSGGYRTFDITKIGHYSGTGLVDFSGIVTWSES